MKLSERMKQSRKDTGDAPTFGTVTTRARRGRRGEGQATAADPVLALKRRAQEALHRSAWVPRSGTRPSRRHSSTARWCASWAG